MLNGKRRSSFIGVMAKGHSEGGGGGGSSSILTVTASLAALSAGFESSLLMSEMLLVFGLTNVIHLEVSSLVGIPGRQLRSEVISSMRILFRRKRPAESTCGGKGGKNFADDKALWA